MNTNYISNGFGAAFNRYSAIKAPRLIVVPSRRFLLRFTGSLLFSYTYLHVDIYFLMFGVSSMVATEKGETAGSLYCMHVTNKVDGGKRSET